MRRSQAPAAGSAPGAGSEQPAESPVTASRVVSSGVAAPFVRSSLKQSPSPRADLLSDAAGQGRGGAFLCPTGEHRRSVALERELPPLLRIVELHRGGVEGVRVEAPADPVQVFFVL